MSGNFWHLCRHGNLIKCFRLEGFLQEVNISYEDCTLPCWHDICLGVGRLGVKGYMLANGAAGNFALSQVSRRDLPVVLASKMDGATTVSATMLLAAAAGISIFVTGGIGGVHRGGEASMDISADLTELSRTPVAVVCAGAKSVLDIPRTLEFLETQGVCVAVMGSDEFPAFFTPHSGCRAPCRIDSPEQAASMLLAAGQVQGLHNSGMLLCCPIPEQFAAEGQQIESAISAALDEATAQGIAGSEVTPFLLERIRSLTGGASLVANIKLVMNNAAIGAQMAKSYVHQKKHNSCQGRSRL
ncbi:pseudouridine-5'-phosphate glycosidase [Dunaliella salina]|uniref:Pseudouridine-5'-phosphate glycosidase n=1 Tax=Dunaliella salina TaxID=3046 RepID=A0ABQ7GEU5_DUNSA|nr:pseudouridine-5'-phosphate glycosidase [Dunaliella salina]|eukprot:KAF5833125.1 pseudouridine-5'-phosphate glycosidase [Dunaliella salina]